MKRLTFAIMAVLLSLSCASRVVNPLLDVKPAQKASYGYTADDPIRIGYTGDRQKNIRFCYNYMECLQTTDGIPLQIISRASVPDPKNEPGNKGPLGFIPRRWGGELWGGILDQYSLIAEG